LKEAGGRRQEAEGTIGRGFRPLPMLFAPFNCGVLHPRPVRSRQETESRFPPASCPLPPAFIDNYSRVAY